MRRDNVRRFVAIFLEIKRIRRSRIYFFIKLRLVFMQRNKKTALLLRIPFLKGVR